VDIKEARGRNSGVAEQWDELREAGEVAKSSRNYAMLKFFNI
jgi:hypothetical protein